MIDINKKNFNNPENLQLSSSYSTISNTLNNPYTIKPIKYGDFSSADPVLNSMLPGVINLGKDNGNANYMKDVVNGKKNLNPGLTSPGFIDNAMECVGLDFVNTNPDYDKLPFQVCLNKFNTEYQIPEIVFNNLMNNLPYTFSALSPIEKKKYLTSLQNFIDTQSKNIKFNTNNTNNTNSTNNTNNSEKKFQKFQNDIEIKEYFGNKNEENSSDSGLSLSGILSIVLIIIIVLIFLLFITNKK